MIFMFKKSDNPLETLNIGEIALIEKWFAEINVEGYTITKNEEFYKKDFYIINLLNVNYIQYRKLLLFIISADTLTEFGNDYIDINKYNFRVIVWDRYTLRIINFKNLTN